jgi:signal transduction histidine kinase/CheY-like chemotaxis protein
MHLSIPTYESDQTFPERAAPGNPLNSETIRLKINPVTLAFREEQADLEALFHQNYFRTNLGHMRLAMSMAALFYGLAGLVENTFLPSASMAIWVIRYGVVVPLFILGVFFSFTRHYEKCWYALSCFYILASGGGFVTMIILGPKPEIYSYYVGVIICLFFGYTFARERFIHASLAGCMVSTFYVAASISVDTPVRDFLHGIQYIFIANSLGMMTCYYIEYSARRDFLLVHLYQEEREKVEAANLRLEKRVEERTADLTSANRRLVEEMEAHRRAEKQKEELESSLRRAQKMESLGTLAGGVAHDLNNILSGVVSYPDLLLSVIPKDDPFRDSISLIKKSGEKAAAIVQDLLTLARRGVAIFSVVNLNTIIDEYIGSPEFRRLQAHHPNVECDLKLEPRLRNVLGSPVHLSKTIMNLVSNAAEAMPEGGTIEIRTGEREIKGPVSGCPDLKAGCYAAVTVSDTGVGIPPEDLEKIFEPFYSKKVLGRSGTGLGMAVVWGTVHDHHGFIDVKSVPGKGTTFELYFPSTDQPIRAEKERIPIDRYKGEGESVLIVDDVREQREIACQMLTSLGYCVTALQSGEAAVEYMRSHSVDLIVLDMIMDPGIDGLETYRQIIEQHPGQRAVIASGFSETRRVAELQELGAGEYIRKPYSVEKLGVAVKKALTGRPGGPPELHHRSEAGSSHQGC